MRVTKTFTFDSAHHLPFYNGLCANMHGHRWTLRVSVDGRPDVNGMIMDFKEMKEIVDPLIERFDHHTLNEFEGNPTCENLLVYIGQELVELGLNWSQLELEESPGSCAQLNADDPYLND